MPSELTTICDVLAVTGPAAMIGRYEVRKSSRSRGIETPMGEALLESAQCDSNARPLAPELPEASDGQRLPA